MVCRKELILCICYVFVVRTEVYCSRMIVQRLTDFDPLFAEESANMWVGLGSNRRVVYFVIIAELGRWSLNLNIVSAFWNCLPDDENTQTCADFWDTMSKSRRLILYCQLTLTRKLRTYMVSRGSPHLILIVISDI